MTLLIAKSPNNRAVLFFKKGDVLFRVYPLIDTSAPEDEVMQLAEKIQEELHILMSVESVNS